MLLPLFFILGSIRPLQGIPPGCLDMNGVWMNAAEDEMHFYEKPRQPYLDRKFTGFYFDRYDVLHAGNKNQKNFVQGGVQWFGIIAFTVLWGKDQTSTSWSGQCFVCGGQNIMNVTWIHRTIAKDCRDSWGATRVNTDLFYKVKNKKASFNPYYKPPPSMKRQRPYSCDLKGIWWDQRGTKLNLRMKDKWTIEGDITKSLTGANLSQVDRIWGRWDSNDATSAIGLYSLPDMHIYGRVAVGFVGQCLLCEGKPTIDLMWVLLHPTRECNTLWFKFMVAHSSFTRQKQR